MIFIVIMIIFCFSFVSKASDHNVFEDFIPVAAKKETFFVPITDSNLLIILNLFYNCLTYDEYKSLFFLKDTSHTEQIIPELLKGAKNKDNFLLLLNFCQSFFRALLIEKKLLTLTKTKFDILEKLYRCISELKKSSFYQSALLEYYLIQLIDQVKENKEFEKVIILWINGKIEEIKGESLHELQSKFDELKIKDLPFYAKIKKILEEVFEFDIGAIFEEKKFIPKVNFGFSNLTLFGEYLKKFPQNKDEKIKKYGEVISYLLESSEFDDIDKADLEEVKTKINKDVDVSVILEKIYDIFKLLREQKDERIELGEYFFDAIEGVKEKIKNEKEVEYKVFFEKIAKADRAINIIFRNRLREKLLSEEKEIEIIQEENKKDSQKITDLEQNISTENIVLENKKKEINFIKKNSEDFSRNFSQRVTIRQLLFNRTVLLFWGSGTVIGRIIPLFKKYYYLTGFMGVGLGVYLEYQKKLAHKKFKKKFLELHK